jgi:hypothetical protein
VPKDVADNIQLGRAADAALAGDIMTLHKLSLKYDLDFNAQVPTVTRMESYAKAPHYLLHYACAGGHDNVVRFLVEQGADLEVCDGESDRPLAWAASRENLSTVRLLLEFGAQVAPVLFRS